MKTRLAFLAIVGLLSALIISGCGSSQETTDDDTGTPPPSVVEKKREPAPAPAVKETVPQEGAVKAEEPAPKEVTSIPKQETAVISSSMPKGKYSVQIGAFSQQEKADLRANVARSRFHQAVYLMRDASTNNVKVMIGDFSVKDDARNFRDQLVQQFPDDYKDAWVFEVPRR